MSGAKQPLKLASIDIGTNSTRLLVAECDGGRTETVDRRMVITRLGEGVDESGKLLPAAMERTLAALGEYATAIERLAPESVEAVATSAVRDVSNGKGFLDSAERVLGVRPKVLTGEREARLSYVGALSDLAGELTGLSGDTCVLVFDIGGGSTELIVGKAGSREHGLRGDAVVAESVNVGCVRMSERFLGNDPPSPLALGRMESKVVNEINSVTRRLLPEQPGLGVGLAGTVTTVSGINLGLEEYDTDSIHHSRLTRREVEEVFMELASVPLLERRQAMGLEADRADIIVGGIAVLRAVMDSAGLDEIIVSEKDILDGLVIEQYLRR